MSDDAPPATTALPQRKLRAPRVSGRGCRHTAIRVWNLKRWSKRSPLRFPCWLWYVLKVEGRSFFGRIQAQLSKTRDTFVGFGPAFEPGDTGYWILRRRTHARVLGIQELETLCPWASSGLDIQVFLRGFDAGEQFALRQVGIQPREPDILATFFDPFVSQDAYYRKSHKSGQTSPSN